MPVLISRYTAFQKHDRVIEKHDRVFEIHDTEFENQCTEFQIISVRNLAYGSSGSFLKNNCGFPPQRITI